MAYGEWNGHMTDHVTWPWKVELVTPIRLEPNISKTAGDSLLWGSTVGYPIVTAWLLVRYRNTTYLDHFYRLFSQYTIQKETNVYPVTCGAKVSVRVKGVWSSSAIVYNADEFQQCHALLAGAWSHFTNARLPDSEQRRRCRLVWKLCLDDPWPGPRSRTSSHATWLCGQERRTPRIAGMLQLQAGQGSWSAVCLRHETKYWIQQQRMTNITRVYDKLQVACDHLQMPYYRESMSTTCRPKYPSSCLWFTRLLSFKRPLLSVEVSVCVPATLMLNISETKRFCGSYDWSCPIGSR